MTALIVANLITNAACLVLLGVFVWGIRSLVKSTAAPPPPPPPKPSVPDHPRLIKGGADE